MKRNIAILMIIIVEILRQLGIDVNIEQANYTGGQLMQGIAALWGIYGVVQSLHKKWKAGEIDLFKILISVYDKYKKSGGK
jgi:hypothetical protein